MNTRRHTTATIPATARAAAVVAAAVLALGLSAAAPALAQADSAQPARTWAGHGPHHGEKGARAERGERGEHGARGHHGMHGKHGMGMHGAMGEGGMGHGMGQHLFNPRLLDSVGATAEQKAQLGQIMDSARADLKALHEAGAGQREQARTLLTQPTVDARAAEALRQQMLAQHDQASRRMLQATLEASRVLTPDQRQQLAARLAERQEKRTQMRQRMMERRAAEPATR